MSILDPVYNAINNTINGAIAGAGSVAGDTVAGVGVAIASTGEGIAESVNGVARSLADYVKEQGNYVKDYTKAPGPRAPTANNPLGLEGVGVGASGKNTSPLLKIPYPILGGGGGGGGSVVKNKKTKETVAPVARKAIAAAPAPATGAIAKPSAQAPTSSKAVSASKSPSSNTAKTAAAPPTPKPSSSTTKPGALPKSNPTAGPLNNKSTLSQPIKIVSKKPANNNNNNNTSPSLASQTNQILAARVKAEVTAGKKGGEAKKGRRGAAKRSPAAEDKTPAAGVKK